MKKYDHTKIEKKWQKVWAKAELYKISDSVKGPAAASAESGSASGGKAKAGKKENFHLLVEFPYPSGNLHVGHWYAFALPDILARAMRMQGKNVLYPIGFDAFGLPAENAAIKNKLNPRKWTEENIAYMKKQIASMGTSFDWSREVITCDPDYYRWTQWLFLQLFKRGLAYQKNTAVNWCPKDKTVLANEQVVNGKCERCEAEVVQKEMLQWNLKITDYADRLIDDLAPLDWPEQIKESQRNWIGRSEGAEIDFPLGFEKKDIPKPNFLLLHGYKGSAKGSFKPWLKEKLERLGYSVQLPDMPNSNEPKESEQVKYIIDNCRIDESTIIVGHSLGGTVAMKILKKINRPIAGLVLVAPAIDSAFPGATKRPFWKDFSWDIDYEQLKKLCSFRVVLSDTLEKVHRGTYLKQLSEKLDAQFVEDEAKKEHFNGVEEPLVLAQLTPHISVFTTRPDTLFGATYLVLAPEHPLLRQGFGGQACVDLLSNGEEVGRYIALSANKTDMERQTNKEKTGVRLEGVEAINPATGERIPVYIADYVLGHYGTGAIMAVPAHDERDFEFAHKFNLPIVDVIEVLTERHTGPDAIQGNLPFTDRQAIFAVIKHWSEDKYLCLRYKPTDVHTFVSGGIEQGEDFITAAQREILEETGYKNVSFIKHLGSMVHSKFYIPNRKQNLFCHFTPLLLQLKDGEQEEVSEKERETHEFQWLKKEEVSNFLNRSDAVTVWERVQAEDAYTGEGILANSGDFTGLSSVEAKEKVTEQFGVKKTTYKLRDWIVSRQRYWGVPIPIIHCKKCGAVAVPNKDLPVKLPKVKDYLPEGSGKSPLAKVTKWVSVKCPQCKGKAERETDTLDTFVDSSWYFLRYTDPKNKKEFASKGKQKNWMPVNLYSGGAEHTTMHVLYSRFWHKALFDLGLAGDSEPYKRRMNRSLILGPDGQKMSKSRGNVVDPDDIVARFGADTVRLYLAFIGPYNEVSSYPWNPNGVVGIRRFLERVCRAEDIVADENVAALNSQIHKTIKKVGEDIAALKFNTAVSSLMILLNGIEKAGNIGMEQFKIFLKLLAPFAPHLAEELWSKRGNKGFIHQESWPAYNPEFLKDDEQTIVVQINGKVRANATVPSDSEKEAVEKAALAAVLSRVEGKKILRTIYVPGRLVNFVLERE